MKTYKQLVREAGETLKAHDLGKRPKVLHLWSDIEWQESPKHDVQRDAEANADDQPIIRLYPALLQTQAPVKSILREVGIIIKGKGGQRASTIWENKLDLPTEAQIEAASSKLTNPALKDKCRTYEQLKDTYPEVGTAVDRLVFLNITNALLANNIPRRDSHGVDIKKWGPTVEYCHFKKYHSLIPLVTVYCPREIVECFGRAFAELLTTNLSCCRESSTAEGLRRIIRNVVSRLEPFPDVD